MKNKLNRLALKASVGMLALLTTVRCVDAATLPASSDTYITEHEVLGGVSSTHDADTALGSIGSIGYQAHPLLRFDLAGLSGRTIVGQPRLELFLLGSHPAGADGTQREISLHEVLVPWDRSLSWQDFGASPGIQEGTDITSGVFTQAIVWPGDGPRYVSWDVPASLVQQWIDTPSFNHGVLLFNRTLPTVKDLWFSSIEDTNSTPPRLVFQLRPAEPQLTIEVSEVRVCWNTESNKMYQLQYRSELTTNAWIAFGLPLMGNGSTNCITDAIATPRKFYRVVVLP